MICAWWSKYEPNWLQFGHPAWWCNVEIVCTYRSRCKQLVSILWLPLRIPTLYTCTCILRKGVVMRGVHVYETLVNYAPETKVRSSTCRSIYNLLSIIYIAIQYHSASLRSCTDQTHIAEVVSQTVVMASATVILTISLISFVNFSLLMLGNYIQLATCSYWYIYVYIQVYSCIYHYIIIIKL